MKAKTIVPLVLGVVVGGAAIKIVVDVVNNAQAATRTDLAQCVVAKVDIDYAEEITPEKLQVKEWPKTSLPAQYFNSVESVNGRVSDMFIAKDVPVYPSMLAPEGTPPGIQVRIKPGFRAVAVAIDEVTGVSYQVKPGDRVDVVALVKHREQGGGVKQMSRIILQNIEVASVGRQLHTDKRGETKSVARSVTLLLRPEEVAELHLAQSLGGRISLALRGTADGIEEQVSDATQDSLFGNGTPEPPRTLPEPPTPKTAEPAPQWSVKVISGNDVEQVDYHWQGDRWEPGEASRLRAVPSQYSPPRGTPENEPETDFISDPDEDSAEES